MSNAQLMQDLYEAFNRGEVPTVLAMDPGIEWRQAEGHPFQPSGMPFVGPDAIVQNVFMRLGTEWDGFTVTPKEFHDAGPAVVVEARYTGTCKQTGKGLGFRDHAEQDREQCPVRPVQVLRHVPSRRRAAAMRRPDRRGGSSVAGGK